MNDKTRIKSVLLVAAGCIAPALSTRAMADNTFFVSNFNDNNIVQFNSAGVGTVFASGLNAPQGLALDTAGNLFVGDVNSARVLKFTPGGTSSVFASGFAAMTGLAFDSAGNLFVADRVTGLIQKFTPAGVPSTFATVSRPFGLAFDSAGNLFSANEGDNTVAEFTPGGTESILASTGVNNPTGTALDGAGNVYVTYSGINTIEKFTPAGTPSVFATTGLNQPSGLAFDAAGNLYAVNSMGNNILKFAPDGTSTVFAASNLNRPFYMAIQHTELPPPPPVTPATTTSNVTANANYKTVPPITATGGFGSTAALLDGVAAGNKSITLGTADIGGKFASLASDVMSVSGTNGDTYVLSLTFDAASANALGGAKNMQLLWLNPSTNSWELAVLGNTGAGNTPTFINGAYDPAADFVLGYYGQDTATNTVWAVINHNSDFAAANLIVTPTAVPEAGSLLIVGLGAAGLIGKKRRRDSAC